MPRVTIVMALYNAAHFVRDAVASVLAQSYSNFELVVVDDASSDDSLAIVESFSDPRIRIIGHTSNMGAALSRNDALAASRGEFIAIMDADDLCASTRIERQIAFLDANPAVGLVGCGIYDNIDENGAVLHTSYLPEYDDAIQPALLKEWCFLHSAIMFRKTLCEKVGGYVAVFEPVEDHEFVLRAVEHCETHNLYEPLVSYRLNSKGLTVRDHQYITKMRSVAIELAQERRSGRFRNSEGEMSRILELKRRRRTAGGLLGAMRRWSDSFFAASRYYGFGCLELCAGRLVTARRCFSQSLRTNSLFLKAWIGAALSRMPIMASGLKFMFQSSVQQHNDLYQLRQSVKVSVPRHSTVADSRPSC